MSAKIAPVALSIDWTCAGPFSGLRLSEETKASHESDYDFWARAETLLGMLLRAYRTEIGGRGYAKTGFTVTYADGDTYSGRIDLTEDNLSLSSHITSFLIAAGEGRMPWLSPASVEQCAAFHAAYQTSPVTAEV